MLVLGWFQECNFLKQDGRIPGISSYIICVALLSPFWARERYSKVE